MPVVSGKFVLAGPRKGQTVHLGGYDFVDGVYHFEGPQPWAENLARYFEANGWAYPEGHPKLKEELNASVATPSNGTQGGNSDSGQGSTEGDAPKPTGDAPAQTGASGGGATTPNGEGVNERLAAALKALDPNDDAHWAKDGRPSMVAVEKIYGSAGITRKDVEAALPGYSREAARAAAS